LVLAAPEVGKGPLLTLADRGPETAATPPQQMAGPEPTWAHGGLATVGRLVALRRDMRAGDGRANLPGRDGPERVRRRRSAKVALSNSASLVEQPTGMGQAAEARPAEALRAQAGLVQPGF